MANGTPSGQRVQYLLLRMLSYPLALQILGSRVLVHGIDELKSLRPARGVLLVSNHRTFFDQFAILMALVHLGVPWVNVLSFPVRARFFYDSPLGTMVNLGLGGGSMYPPIFRDTGRSAHNDRALAYLVTMLERPGHVVGIHPEGTRNRGENPYELLPAQPGVGKIALHSGAPVVPIFTSGLSNDLLGEFTKSRAPDASKAPILVTIGAPVDYADLRAKPPRLALHKQAADRFMGAVAALIPTERATRAAIASGEVANNDPRWLRNHPVPFGAGEVWARSKGLG